MNDPILIEGADLELIDRMVDSVAIRLVDIEAEMALPQVAVDSLKMKHLAREYHRLQQLQTMRRRMDKLRSDLEGMNEALHDAELAELAEAELPMLQTELEKVEGKLLALLLPEVPEDSRNAMVELRAGAGGEEAALFAEDLLKMYTRYFEQCGFRQEIVTGNFSDLGGVKEVILSVKGEAVYGRLKYESGVHRVQRVPLTEASGRIHTSAATVAVLPEAEEVDVTIDPADLKIDTFRSSGPGGQHVNKTDSAVRITHIPTGIVVICQDEKSQNKNKRQALKVLRSRLFKIALEEEQDKRAAQRRSLVSTGNRSAKIRTYNFPQNRVTDHRVPVTVHRLDEILGGSLDMILNPVIKHFAALRLVQNEK